MGSWSLSGLHSANAARVLNKSESSLRTGERRLLHLGSCARQCLVQTVLQRAKTRGVDMPQGRLRDEGIQKYGLTQSCHFWRCQDCGTTYPEINGKVSCNGRAIEVCECSDGTDSPWTGSKLPGSRPTVEALSSGTLAPGLWD